MIDFDGLTTGPCMETFGEACVYRPAGGLPSPVIGIYDESYQPLMPLGDLGGEIGVSAQITTSMPVLGIRLAAWPAVPQQDDVVVIRGIAFTVREVQQDGEGWALLKLNVGD